MTPTATLSIAGLPTPAVLLAVSIDDHGAPVFAPHHRPGLLVRESQLVESLIDLDGLRLLAQGAPLRIWAGSERVVTLRAQEGAHQTETGGVPASATHTWHGEEGPIARFGALTLAKAFTADHKAWLRAPRR